MSASPDPRELLRRALAQSSEVIASVRPDQLDGPTPCEKFDVRTLIGHMTFAADRVAEAGRRDTIAPVGDTVSTVADGELASAFDAAARRVADAWNRPGALDGDIDLPFGSYPAPAVVSIYVIEHVVHAWDLAVATGSPVVLDDELAGAALSAAEETVPADQYRGGEDMPFGEVVAVAPDAPVYDRLAGYLGRDPSARFAASGGTSR